MDVIFMQSFGNTGQIINLEGTLMEHDLPIADFRFSDGKLIYLKEYPENGDAYFDLWTPGSLTEKELQSFLSYRVPVWRRPSVQMACRRMGILPRSADQYIQKVHGVWGDDHFWIRFPSDGSICWDDVKIRD